MMHGLTQTHGLPPPLKTSSERIGMYPEVWGPKYWFFLHTISFVYPINPSESDKKKYYELIHNLDMFIPDQDTREHYAELILECPIQPYLTNRQSLVTWMHFIHNKINLRLGLREINMDDFSKGYWSQFVPHEDKKTKNERWIKVIYLALLCSGGIGLWFILSSDSSKK